MTPAYLDELADIADPDQLWRLPVLEQLDLPADKRRQLDAGVALRRHASHVAQLRELLNQRRSLLITPLSENSAAVKSVDTPPDHARLRQVRDAADQNAGAGTAPSGGGCLGRFGGGRFGWGKTHDGRDVPPPTLATTSG